MSSFCCEQGIVFLSDCILGAPSYPVPVQPMRKVIKEEPEEEDDGDGGDGKEVIKENEGNKTDQTEVRKRVCIECCFLPEILLITLAPH